MAEHEIVVRNNEAEQHYETEVDGHRGVIEYDQSGDRIELIHTEVDPALEGRGIAGQLAQFALEDARARHLTVVPLCPYVVSYLRRHQEYADVIAPEYRHHVTKSR
ncbi:MAG TPA: GNAT family N-acetyltransferase [Ktedonobacterales bacterium]